MSTGLGAIMNYRELFVSVHERPGLYGLDGSFRHFCVFVEGCNAGTFWSLLAGFREWLVMQLGEVSEGNNLTWPALILRLARQDSSILFSSQAEGNTIGSEVLFRLLDSFLELRQRSDSLATIFREYSSWLDEYHVRIHQNIPGSGD
jgi:hypothetical protein